MSDSNLPPFEDRSERTGDDGGQPRIGRSHGDEIVAIRLERRQHLQLRRRAAGGVGLEHAARQIGAVGTVVLGVKPKCRNARAASERRGRAPGRAG